MNLAEFERVLNQQRAAEDDRKWFPKWYARFEEYLGERQKDVASVSRELLVEFSRTLLK